MGADLAQPLAPLLHRFRNVRRTIRTLFVLDGFSMIAILAGLYAVVVPPLDWLLYLPRGVRVLFLILAGCGAGWLAVRRIVRPCRIPLPDEDLAVYVERAHPHLRDRLRAAIELARMDPEREGHFNSPELVRHLVDQVAAGIGAVAPERIVRRRPVAVRGTAAVAMLMAVAGGAVAAAYFLPEHFRAGWRRLLGMDVRWPQRTFLEVLPFDETGTARIAKGDSFEVEVIVSGPGRPRLQFRFDTGHSDWVLMERDPSGDRYRHRFESVMDRLELRVTAGDAEAGPFRVEVLPRPRVDQATFTLDYPDYILPEQIARRGLPPEGQPVAAGDLRDVPFHTRFRLEGRSNVPLRRAVVAVVGRTALGGEWDAAVQDRSFQQEFVLAESQAAVEISLFALSGLESQEIVRFELRGKPDEPPSIDVQAPSTDEYVTARCRYPVRLTARDDYGVAQVALGWQNSLGSSGMQSFAPPVTSAPYPAETIRASTRFDLEPMGLRDGDWVLLTFVATDNRAMPGEDPGRHETRGFRLTVVSEDRLADELKQKVDEIKRRIERARLLQESTLERTAALRQELSALDVLAAGDKARLAELERDELRVRREIVEIHRELSRVRERGEYNRIFDDSSLERLDAALAELEALAGRQDATPAPTLAAAHALGEAARVHGAADRRRLLLSSEEQQTAIVNALTHVLNMLGRWTSYQEIVRLFKQIRDMQRIVADQLRRRPQ